VAANAADGFLAELETRYRERHRAYHTLAHVATMVGTVDELRVLVTEPDAVTLAVWYHDAVYRPRRTDNEAASARLAEGHLQSLGVDSSTIDRVTCLILTTATHTPVPDLLDSGAFLDADLAILGMDPMTYDAYAKAIRREYRWVPAPLYRRERARVLERFLGRGSLYFTEPMRRRLEAQARANLARELGTLRG
jgi:predicted metal-dependent HD superfamily phosphohydrolase